MRWLLSRKWFDLEDWLLLLIFGPRVLESWGLVSSQPVHC